MLSSNNPAFPSLPPELLPPSAHARSPLSDRIRGPPRGSGSPSRTIALDGSESPSQPEERVAPSWRLAQTQQLQQHHPFNAARPSLSPLSEYHSGFSDADLGGAPYSPANSHRRQHSFPNLLPAAFRSRTPSPTRKVSKLSDQMPFTGDSRPGKVDSPKTGGLAGWFSNMSSQDDDGASAADTTPTRARRAMTTTTNLDPSTPKSTVTSRFMSAISSRFASTPTSPIIDDELCNLNIEGALFPATSPRSDPDPFSPAAFKNLQMNALGLLARFQSAYRDRVATVRELQAEKLAQREELEEAETRARHLKMQLEGMARKAQDQEKEMQALVDELSVERKARIEAEKFVTEESLASEDLGVDEDRRRRKWLRKSGETLKSEGGFETDEESAESESVFSRCRSPTMGNIDGTSTVRSNASIAPARRGQPKEMNTFQKIIKGIAGESTEEAGLGECRNCKGQDASVAWDTVSLLRDENRHLKVRVGELETAVEGALDMVNGIGL